jgi:alkylation response protein AidB-like acyl-CoA dehydrogenase
LCASAIAHAGEAALRATREGVQTLGGHGFITDYPIERWYRCAPRSPRSTSTPPPRGGVRLNGGAMTIELASPARPSDCASACASGRCSQARPLAREADRRHAAPEGADAVLAACPVGHRLPAAQHSRAVRSTRRSGRRLLLVTALVQEAIAYGDGWPLWTNGGSIGQNVVKGMGTPEQKERWVGGTRARRDAVRRVPR